MAVSADTPTSLFVLPWQEEKVYVQHKLVEQGALVWQYLSSEKAHVFIAG